MAPRCASNASASHPTNHEGTPRGAARSYRAGSGRLPGLESDGKLVWTYKEAMVPTDFPKSILVIGSGEIGIEFAIFYRTPVVRSLAANGPAPPADY